MSRRRRELFIQGCPAWDRPGPVLRSGAVCFGRAAKRQNVYQHTVPGIGLAGVYRALDTQALNQGDREFFLVAPFLGAAASVRQLYPGHDPQILTGRDYLYPLAIQPRALERAYAAATATGRRARLDRPAVVG